MDNNKSREYIKALTPEQRKKIAKAIHVSHEYIYMIGIGERTPSRKLAVMLERETKKHVKSADFETEARYAVSA
jgi:DNA-binding XRE family transcriptional regulator